MLSWVERVNQEIHYNVAAAMDCMDVGLEVPELQFLRNMTREESDAIISNPEWEVMGDTGMVMKKVTGPEVFFHAFYKDEEFTCRTISISDPYLLNGNQGPWVGDNGTTLFCGSSESIEPTMEKLAQMASRKERYLGFINLGVVFNGGKPYYRSLVYGTTEKFVGTILRLYDAGISSFFSDAMRETRNIPVAGYVAAIRLWAFPYSSVEQNRNLNVKDIDYTEWDGESYIIHGKGNKIIDAWKDLYSRLPKNGERGICFRTDGDVKPRRVMNELMRSKALKRVKSTELPQISEQIT
jgi:hypothetical protein